MNWIKKSVCAVSSVALILSLNSCVGPPANEWVKQENSAKCPIDINSAAGTLHIAYLGGPRPELYIYDQALAEACLPQTKITWTRIPTGQETIQAIAAGDIDLTVIGSSPTAKALSAPLNLDIVTPQIAEVIGDAEALVAKNSKTIHELIGKTIAVPFGSTAHYSLLSALMNEGIFPGRDVNIINVSPDSLPSAWASDDIEAVYAWDPALQNVKQDGTVVTTSRHVADIGAPTFSVMVSARKWAENNSSILATFQKLWDWAVKYSVENFEDYVSVNAQASGMSEEAVRSNYEGSTLYTLEQQHEGLDLLAEGLCKTAEFLESQGEIDAAASLDRCRNSADSRFVDQVIHRGDE